MASEPDGMGACCGSDTKAGVGSGWAVGWAGGTSNGVWFWAGVVSGEDCGVMAGQVSAVGAESVGA